MNTSERRDRPVREASADSGFTLIELLVVMIIIGILAAVAIPVFLSQRAKAKDSATASDTNRLGKELAAYFVDGAGPAIVNYTAPTATVTGRITITDAGGYASGVLVLSAGTVQPSPATLATSGLGSSTGWCVSLSNPGGSVKNYSYTAANGLQKGTTC